MTKVSRRLLAPKEQRLIEQEFWKALARLGTPKEVELFLSDLLTHTERKMLSKRLQVARMLLEKQSYGQIVRALHVTDVTISKINNWLNTFGRGYRLAVEKLSEKNYNTRP